MANEKIMLAKTYKEGMKLKYPVYVSEKLDGVAGDLVIKSHKSKNGKVITVAYMQSRQGEILKSSMHIVRELIGEFPDTLEAGMHFIGELYIPGMDFKDISGYARRDEQDEDTDKLEFHIYDFYEEGKEHVEYEDRMERLVDVVGPNTRLTNHIVVIPTTVVTKEERMHRVVQGFLENNCGKRPTGPEGIIIRQARGKGSDYQVGKRPSGFIKKKLIETIDLKVVGFEEALDVKTKAPLGMVGRVILAYKNGTIGAGPGYLSHPERKAIHENPSKYIGRVAEIAYMPDESYEALREPRFWYWRPDKD